MLSWIRGQLCLHLVFLPVETKSKDGYDTVDEYVKGIGPACANNVRDM